MSSLPSSAESKLVMARHQLVTELYLQEGPFWDGIAAIRRRWNVEPQTRVPEASEWSDTSFLPDCFDPWPPDDDLSKEPPRSEETERWLTRIRDWTSDLHALYDAAVPQEGLLSKYPAVSWELFLSMCVLFDPPETKLLEFADRFQWSYSNVIPRGNKGVAGALPIVWIRDADQAETTMREFYEGLLEALLEKYVHPQGVSSEDALETIHNERPDLLAGLLQGFGNNKSHPYIDVKTDPRKEDILSAWTLLRERLAVQRTSGGTRDPLIALQCAILYDDYNGPNPEDRREKLSTHKTLAQMFGLQGPRAAKDYIEMGREIRKNRTAN
jgi:hypothetical protein